MLYIRLVLILIFLAACSPAPEQESTRPPLPATEDSPITAAAAIPSPTVAPSSAPTATPIPVQDLPALEILGGAADSCVNAEAYSQVLSFAVRYYEVTTANRIHYRLADEEGNILDENDASGENKDGEEGWGFYPLAYEVPANSPLTLTIEVYESTETDAMLTSSSSISFNCTTGAVAESSFERAPDQ